MLYPVYHIAGLWNYFTDRGIQAFPSAYNHNNSVRNNPFGRQLYYVTACKVRKDNSLSIYPHLYDL